MARVGLVGNLSIDCIDGAPPRVGGPPYHGARGLQVLGVPAVVVTKFADADRPLVLPPLEALGPAVHWRAATTTASYSFGYDGDAREMVVEAVGDRWTTEDAETWAGDALRRVRWLHVGALARDEFGADTLARLARDRRISFDGQGLTRPSRTGPLELDGDPDPDVLRHLSILKLSEEEAHALVGPRLGERPLYDLGVPEVVVTLGSRGSLVLERRRLLHVPARPLHGVDPTGAGDAFAAAYLVARSRGHGPVGAARRATSVVRAVLERAP
jgi:sugar/nucleoside kinase (ribokinase family)